MGFSRRAHPAGLRLPKTCAEISSNLRLSPPLINLATVVDVGDLMSMPADEIEEVVDPAAKKKKAFKKGFLAGRSHFLASRRAQDHQK